MYFPEGKYFKFLLPPKVQGGVFHNLSGRFPALFPALGVLSVLLPEQFFPRENFGFLPGYISALFLLAVIFIFYHEKKSILLFAASAFLSFLTFLPEGKGKELENYFFSSRATGIEIKFAVRDPALVPELLPNPKTILGEAEAIRYPGETSYQLLPKGNFLILRLPGRFAQLGYGEKWALKGFLEKSPDPLFPGEFSYGEYLKRRGIAGIVKPYEMVKCGEEKSFSSFLYSLRYHAMKKVLSHISTPEYRAMAGAILFGCTQGILRETREELTRSGLIHILTVSGLHIGLFAALAGVIFCFLPFRLRYFAILISTFFYALATGMGVPAARAFIMVTFYCLGKAFYVNNSAINSLAFSFAFILLWKKEELLLPGFLYSFTATFILLLSGNFLRKHILFFREKELWKAVPGSRIREWKVSLPEKIFFSLFACYAAWMVTGILTLHFQGVYAVLSPFANLLLLPVIWLFYPVFLLGSIVGCFWEKAAEYSAILLEYLCGTVKLISSFTAAKSFLLPPSGALLTIFMLLLLFLPFLLPKKKLEVLLLGTIPFFLIFTICLFFPFPGAGKIAILEVGGEKKAPAILYSDPENDLAFAVNIPPSFPIPGECASYFKREGHKKLLFLLVTGTGKKELENLEYFLRTMNVKYLILPRPGKNSFAAKEFSRKVAETGTQLHFIEGKRGKNHLFQLDFSFRGKGFTFHSSDKFISLKSNGKELFRKEKSHTLLPELTFFPIYRPEKEKKDSAFLEVTLPHSSKVIFLHSATTLAI